MKEHFPVAAGEGLYFVCSLSGIKEHWKVNFPRSKC